MTFGLKVLGASSVLSALNDLRVPGDSPEYVVGTNVEYAPYVEFGTSKMSAQPYLRPAADKAQSNLSAIAGDANDLEHAIRLIALDIERESKRRCPVDTGNLKNSIAAEKV